jgi:RNA polymerase sigma-70 factor (ECF subfamily)
MHDPLTMSGSTDEIATPSPRTGVDEEENVMDSATKCLPQQIAEEIPHLRRYAHSLSRHADDGDDLMQTALERALRHIHQFQPGTGMRRWLFTIVRHAHIDERRKHARRPRHCSVDDYGAEPAGPAGQEHHVELEEVVRRLGTLRATDRFIVRLSAVEGLPQKEIADRLGVATGTVKSRLWRARQALAAGLDG